MCSDSGRPKKEANTAAQNHNPAKTQTSPSLQKYASPTARGFAGTKRPHITHHAAAKIMSLVQDITHDLTQAMKAREEPRLSTLRMLKAELQKLQADKGRSYEISDSDVQTVIKRLIKQRKDAAEQYSSGGAADRAQAELAEVKILEPYLPSQLSDETLTALITEAAAEINASSPKDMGKLMKAVMSKAKGQADGSRVKELVNTFLNK